jgi:Tol biopolymer transport system component
MNKKISAPIAAMLIVAMLSVSAGGYAQIGLVPEKYLWLGEPLPGAIPKLFAPGKVSDAMSNRDMAISPEGDELFYTIQSAYGQVSTVLYMHYSPGSQGGGAPDGPIEAGWSAPEIAPFSGVYGDLEPAFSAGGDTLYFVSNRPLRNGDPIKDYDIWMVKKDKGNHHHWGEPIRLDTVINSEKDEFYPSIARNGNLYFTRNMMKSGKGGEDIVVSEWKNGRYQPPYSLPEAINSARGEFNAFVDPDEQFLLFSSYGRKDDLGGGDLYLSFKDGKGEWLPAAHLDSTINSDGIDFCPFVSPDKKYLFFTSGRMKDEPPFKRPLNFRGLQALLENPGNGLNDVYWMEWKPVREKYFPTR